MMAPLVLEVVLHLKRNPVPYVVAIALPSNAGSVATLTGNPQNMIIGSLSRIPYPEFAAALTPVAAAGLAIGFVLVALAWRREFLCGGRLHAKPPAGRVARALLAKTVLVLAGLAVAFASGVRPAVLLLKPFVADRDGWLVVAMASTLAGNFTILGSVANLIVVQWARA